MAKWTDTFSVNNIGDPEPVTVNEACQKVTIGEKRDVAGWPTTDWYLRMPLKTSPAVPFVKGDVFDITVDMIHTRAQLAKDEIIAYVETASGTTTFFKIGVP